MLGMMRLIERPDRGQIEFDGEDITRLTAREQALHRRRIGMVFRETLLDENATCHIAWGAGIPSVLPGWRSLSDDQLRAAGINQSATHIDFMIGGPEVTVTGLHADGTRIPILRAGTWQLTTAEGP